MKIYHTPTVLLQSIDPADIVTVSDLNGNPYFVNGQGADDSNVMFWEGLN